MDQNSPLAAALRWMISTLGVWLVSKGMMDEGTWTLVSGAVMALGALAWSVASKRMPALLQSAAKLDDVAKIVVNDPALASGVPSPKVVTR